MGFRLEGEVSGLCQYVIQEDHRAVGIVMPDGRQNGRPIPPYDYKKFNKYLVHHVGYLRYDLGDLAPTGVVTSPLGRAGTPSSEVIYRFNFDHLKFGFEPADDDMVPRGLDMPDLARFAPMVSTRPSLFSDNPPNELLMRTILRGGSLTTRPFGGWSEFDTSLQPNGGAPYRGQFAGFATWSRTVPDDRLLLRIRDWKGNVKNVIQLNPREPNGTIRLKIANLCAENPLEWPELFLRAVTDAPDNDFKWFYFLWEDRRGSFEKLLNQNGQNKLLPVPVPIPAHGEVSNCTGSQITVGNVGGT